MRTERWFQPDRQPKSIYYLYFQNYVSYIIIFNLMVRIRWIFFKYYGTSLLLLPTGSEIGNHSTHESFLTKDTVLLFWYLLCFMSFGNKIDITCIENMIVLHLLDQYRRYTYFQHFDRPLSLKVSFFEAKILLHHKEENSKRSLSSWLFLAVFFS